MFASMNWKEQYIIVGNIFNLVTLATISRTEGMIETPVSWQLL